MKASTKIALFNATGGLIKSIGFGATAYTALRITSYAQDSTVSFYDESDLTLAMIAGLLYWLFSALTGDWVIKLLVAWRNKQEEAAQAEFICKSMRSVGLYSRKTLEQMRQDNLDSLTGKTNDAQRQNNTSGSDATGITTRNFRSGGRHISSMQTTKSSATGNRPTHGPGNDREAIERWNGTHKGNN